MRLDSDNICNLLNRPVDLIFGCVATYGEPDGSHRVLYRQIHRFQHSGDVDSVRVTCGSSRGSHALEFIQEQPHGFDTIVGDRGVKLSGGQRQRISVARALIKNPPILILDEATSALDSEAERKVQEAIDRLMKDRTVFVIAHRLSTVVNADRIGVLREGSIVEEGTHDELLQKNGEYKRLYEMQFKANSG